MSSDKQELTPSWMDYMRAGNFGEAWKLSDSVLESRAGIPCWHLPRHFQYIWDGSPPDGKRVLVRCYHGLGDTIQFIRFIPLLKKRASRVVVWAQHELIPLLQSIPEIDELLPLHNGRPECDYDMDVEIMELSHLFRTTLATLPCRIPYLSVEPQRLSSSGLPSVGLVWKAGNWDEQRCIPFPMLAPLAEVSGINLYILQANARSAGWHEGFGIHPGEFSLYDYARVIAGLDLLISIDSMPVHLAGALGIPVWNLLRAQADWRWMQDRDDSPWYPSMRLFRQVKEGDWQSVIQQVTKELKEQFQTSAA